MRWGAGFPSAVAERGGGVGARYVLITERWGRNLRAAVPIAAALQCRGDDAVCAGAMEVLSVYPGRLDPTSLCLLFAHPAMTYAYFPSARPVQPRGCSLHYAVAVFFQDAHRRLIRDTFRSLDEPLHLSMVECHQFWFCIVCHLVPSSDVSARATGHFPNPMRLPSGNNPCEQIRYIIPIRTK